MNRKGFSLIELLGALLILGVILCIGLYSARGTLATTLSTLNNVSVNEIYDAAESYVLENGVTWINDGNEYTCLIVNDLVDAGYFDQMEVSSYKDEQIKVIRNAKTKVVTNVDLVSECN